MTNSSVVEIRRLIFERLRLPLMGQLENNSGLQRAVFWPEGHRLNESFEIGFVPGWRSLDIDFRPRKFAGGLVAQMAEVDDTGRALFLSFVELFKRNGASCEVRVNQTPAKSENIVNWPKPLEYIEISVRKRNIVFDQRNDSELLNLADDLLVPFVGLVVGLIGSEEEESGGEVEGAKIQSHTSRYERKLANREACLRLHGRRCKACGFAFGDFYGEFATDYVEVHHLSPLSSQDQPTAVDPRTDLVPLCSNCHAAVHLEDPPVPVDVLQERIDAARRGTVQ